MKAAVIGTGNMGSTYASMLFNRAVSGLELAAVTRISQSAASRLKPLTEAGIPVYESADRLLEAVENGQLDIDAVIVATPHYSHAEITIRALKAGLHVLCEKPAGVYSRQSRLMEEAAAGTGKELGFIFNQRAMPVYQKLFEIVRSGKYGSLKRVNWTITDWYRPELYYKTSSWHATWDKDGGGVILNQCPHNLDLLQWICGMPARIQAFCHEGHFHDIEVEDDVTAYMEWANGATGVFVTSTGDAPGLNRLEISLEEAMLVCEKGVLKIGDLWPELGQKESEYRAVSKDFFKPVSGTWSVIPTPPASDTYLEILKCFSDACNGRGRNTAPAGEGRKSLLIGNAIYLSSWNHCMVELPEPGSASETEFEKIFEEALENKIKEKRI